MSRSSLSFSNFNSNRGSSNGVSNKQQTTSFTKRSSSKSSKSLDQVKIPTSNKSKSFGPCVNGADVAVNDYSDLYISTYKNAFGNTYCFHSNKYIDLIQNAENFEKAKLDGTEKEPLADDINLPPNFIEELKKRYN